MIEEIEEMMQDSPDPEDDESPSQSDLSMLSQDLGALRRSGSNTSYEDRECGVVCKPASNYTERSSVVLCFCWTQQCFFTPGCCFSTLPGWLMRWSELCIGAQEQ